MNVSKALEKARHEHRANKKFLGKLKQRPPRDLDRQFRERHEEVFAELDCLDCANCCKTTSPIFRDVDIERLASHLGIRPGELIERHLHLDGEGDYVLNVAPCPFLGSDNYCSVYEARPRACREYPHTDRKNMYQILPLTLRNSLVCPAVGRILRSMRYPIVLLLLCCGASLTAGPWPQPVGGGYFKLYEWWMRFDEHFTSQGELDPNATIGLYNTTFYGEYGVTERLTAIANLPIYSRSTINNQIGATRGTLISEGDAIGGLGDADLGLRYTVTPLKAALPVSVSVLFGLPLGEAAGGREGNLQTGDGEFNQLVQLEVGRSFTVGNLPAYAIASVGFNQRSNGFSDEYRYGLEAGFSFLEGEMQLIGRLRGSESLFNGETAAAATTSIFSNNAEYLSIGGELNYYFTDRLGLSAGIAGAVSGRIIAAAPVYSIGVFLQTGR